jgi:hypothetical protein
MISVTTLFIIKGALGNRHILSSKTTISDNINQNKKQYRRITTSWKHPFMGNFLMESKPTQNCQDLPV